MVCMDQTQADATNNKKELQKKDLDNSDTITWLQNMHG